MDNWSCSLHCIWKLWSIRKIIDLKYFNRALKFKVHVVILILIRCLWSIWFNIDLFILYFETQTWYRTVIGLWNSISQYMIWIDVYSSRPDSSGKSQVKWCGWTGFLEYFQQDISLVSSMKTWSNWTTNYIVGFWSSREVQNTLYMPNLMIFCLRYLRLNTIDTIPQWGSALVVRGQIF